MTVLALVIPEENAKILHDTDGTQRCDPATTVNPAAFLWAQQGEGNSEHNGLQALEEVYSRKAQTEGRSLTETRWGPHTDSSSFVKEGKRALGYAVTTVNTLGEARALPTRTAAQKAGLMALT